MEQLDGLIRVRVTKQQEERFNALALSYGKSTPELIRLLIDVACDNPPAFVALWPKPLRKPTRRPQPAAAGEAVGE